MSYLKFIRTVTFNQTQKEIAEIIGVTERQYRRIENYECLPSYDTILALESYFNRPVRELLNEYIPLVTAI